MERGSNSRKKNLKVRKEKYVTMFMEVLEEYNQLQSEVLDHQLHSWKNDQRENGYGDKNRLICIQNLCEDLAENILLLKETFEQIGWEICPDSIETGNIPEVIIFHMNS